MHLGLNPESGATSQEVETRVSHEISSPDMDISDRSPAFGKSVYVVCGDPEMGLRVYHFLNLGK
jgi:hypothetical protein